MILRLFSLLILLLPLSCSRISDDRRMWTWSPTAPAPDSLTHRIELMHVHAAPSDSMWKQIRRLSGMASGLSGEQRRLLQARVIFMEGRQLYSDGKTGEAREAAARALAMIDEKTHPYEFHRLRGLSNSMLTTRTPESFKEILRDLEYWEECGDQAMIASTCIRIGNHLGEAHSYEEALKYLQRADSINGLLGLNQLCSKNRINATILLHGLGRHRERDSITALLLKDPVVRKDPGAYNLVLYNKYLHTGDRESLQKAYDINKHDSNPQARQALYEALISRSYGAVGMPDSADYYALKAIRHIDKVKNYMSRANIWMADAERLMRSGDLAGAYASQSRYVADIDSASIVRRPQEIIHMQNMQAFAAVETEKIRLRHGYELRFAIFGIVAVVLLAGLAVYISIRDRQHKMEKQRNITAKVQAELDKERNARQLMALSLAMEETDKTLDTVKQEIRTLHSSGVLDREGVKRIDMVLRNHSMQKEDWKLFEYQFKQAHPNFMSNLRRRCPDITESQMRLAVYIYIGMTNKQIASFLNIRPESVKQARWRLRSRLEIDSEVSLEEALAHIDEWNDTSVAMS